MKKIKSATDGNVASYSRRLVFLRMCLGILLCLKGIYLLSNNTALHDWLAQQQQLIFPFTWLAMVVGIAQMLGGIFIVLGLFTRWVCLMLLPIVTMVLLIKFSDFTLSDYALLEIISIFAGLILFLEKGAGRASLDRRFRGNQSDRLVFWV